MIIHRHAQIGSTNDELLRLAADGALDGTIVVAGRQLAGRGRQRRHWVSPPGNLYASFLVRMARFTQFVPARVAQIGLVAAVALAETLAGFGAAIRLKWPNDVLCGKAKIAGILVELADEAAVIGIGVNVAHHPQGMAYPVTSLAAEGVEVGAEAVLQGLAGRLTSRLADWDAGGFAPIRALWLERGPAVGTVLSVQAGAGRVAGGFAGLDADGALLLSVEDGLRRIVGGEVFGG